MGNNLLLKAERHNWGLIGEGDWITVQWLIYSDRYFEINVQHCLSVRDRVFKVKSGRLRKERFTRLLEAMEKPWINPDIISGGCDGAFPAGRNRKRSFCKAV